MRSLFPPLRRLALAAVCQRTTVAPPKDGALNGICPVNAGGGDHAGRGRRLVLAGTASGSHRQKTAIDGEFHAGNVGGLVASQEKVGVGDLFDAPIASHRDRLQHAGPHLGIGG